MIFEGKVMFKMFDCILLGLQACSLENLSGSSLLSLLISLGRLYKLTFSWGFYRSKISLSCKQYHNAFHHQNQIALKACFG